MIYFLNLCFHIIIFERNIQKETSKKFINIVDKKRRGKNDLTNAKKYREINWENKHFISQALFDFGAAKNCEKIYLVLLILPVFFLAHWTFFSSIFFYVIFTKTNPVFFSSEKIASTPHENIPLRFCFVLFDIRWNLNHSKPSC